VLFWHQSSLSDDTRLDISEEGGIAIGEALMHNSTLTFLDLSGNTLHSTTGTGPSLAIMAIARALQSNWKLVSLNL